MNLKKIISIILVVFLFTGCGKKAEKENGISNKKLEIPEYEHYDIEDFKQRCLRLSESVYD